ncbi:MAG: transposase [Selenomonadaceae bacterium]|nr:transposase [Selenomonadaceae bacterium]
MTTKQFDKLLKAKNTGRPPLDNNAIFWILRTYVNWNSIYNKFQQWIEQGIFINLLQEWNSGKSVLIEIDSTYCKVQFDKEIYKQRNIVERYFNKIKNNRHIAMRFDKLSICFWNFIVIVAIRIKLK